MHRGIGVFLRVHHPHQDIHHANHPLDNLPVLHPGGIEVRQVQKHQPTVLVGKAGNRRKYMTVLHVQPIEQGSAAVLAPDTRQRLGGGGPPRSRGGQFAAGNCVEQG
ncbi:hypothetical protein PJL18_04180 [Paenarthrobacter nicotinovorans]|nr:hypothetical protein [Paenarthrobacter nicotinovorans]